MPAANKARAIGFNHVALEVGDIDALAFEAGRASSRPAPARSDRPRLRRGGPGAVETVILFARCRVLHPPGHAALARQSAGKKDQSCLASRNGTS
jgi:hypothetical protein